MNRNFRRFEALENRLCLSVSVAVNDGDLVVSGDADGAVEIVAVGAGAYRVTDNGVLIADESTLTGVTDDIHIQLEETIAGTNDTVTIDLGGETVDRIYAQLGDGDNSFELTNGTAAGITYRGGDGIDSVSLSAAIESRAVVSLGDGRQRSYRERRRRPVGDPWRRGRRSGCDRRDGRRERRRRGAAG